MASFTFRIPMSLMTGEEIVVMRSRMAAAKRRKVPTWWKRPVTAIFAIEFARLFVGVVSLLWFGGDVEICYREKGRAKPT